MAARIKGSYNIKYDYIYFLTDDLPSFSAMVMRKKDKIVLLFILFISTN
ncbi:hypothetical protein CSC12_0373 [Klebsiella michiganensis]|nr:hypothetical protein CSC12_0373 [Klebsiella michiganensis]